MTLTSQALPRTNQPHFATLLVMALAPADVGARITQARQAKGWTHEEFARQAGVGLRTVQRWQKGVSPEGKSWLPRLGTLMDLADLLEVPRSYFVEEEQAQATLDDLREELATLAEQVAGLRADLKGGGAKSARKAAPRQRR